MSTVNKETLKSLLFVVFDFDGVFTDNRVIVSEDGKESVVCSRADGIGLKRLRECGVETMVLSLEKNPVVQKRCEKLQMTCHQGCEDKLSFLKNLLAEKGIDVSQVAYVGNDINDLECLGFVGLPIAVADSFPEVIEKVAYVTKAKGGYGAVREVCDLIVGVKTHE